MHRHMTDIHHGMPVPVIDALPSFEEHYHVESFSPPHFKDMPPSTAAPSAAPAWTPGKVKRQIFFTLMCLLTVFLALFTMLHPEGVAHKTSAIDFLHFHIGRDICYPGLPNELRDDPTGLLLDGLSDDISEEERASACVRLRNHLEHVLMFAFAGAALLFCRLGS